MASQILSPLAGLAAPTPATLAKSINANGPIQDYPGMIRSLQQQAAEFKAKVKLVISATDGSDPNLTALNTLLGNI